MTVATICACGEFAGPGHDCEHRQTVRQRENSRRHAKTVAHGRNTPHWRRLTMQARRRDKVCQDCGTTEHLTGHLDPAMQGDHTAARLEDVTTLCRRCHGRRDGRRAHAA